MAVRGSLVKRFVWVYCVIVLLFAVVVLWTAVKITTERDEWLAVSASMQRKGREKMPERGNIYSDNGSLISTTVPYYSLYMDTRVPALHQKGGELYKQNIDSLCYCLSMKFKDKSPAEYRNMIDRAYARGDGKLKLYPKRVSYIDLQEIKQFPLIRRGRYKSGFIPEEYVKRENLYGNLAGRTVGNIYGSGKGGQYGLEMYYDSILSGVPGYEEGIRAGNQWIYVPTQDAEPGVDLVTTIDIEIQDIAESILRDKLSQFKASKGCLVMMEVKTGQIKAIVNLMRNSDGTYSEGANMAVSDLSEPGSTFKIVSMAVALDNGLCDTADRMDICHGQYRFYDRVMNDHNWKTGGYDTLSMNEVIAYSSNVGVSRLIEEHYKDKPEEFVDAVLNTGFADDIELEIPGAVPPSIKHPDTYKYWSKVSLPWMSIGYVSQVPPIYTLNYYNAIANGGRMMRPYLVKQHVKDGVVLKEIKPEVLKSSICKSSTLGKLQGMLRSVVEFGTNRRYGSKHFAIAGKTGTAQLGYGTGGVVRHQVSFCGYFPADNPMYSCIVVVREPQAPPAAGAMAGDVFLKVAERVYAQKINCEIDDLARYDDSNDEEPNLPRVKNGSRKKTEHAMRRAGVRFDSDDDGDWVTTARVDDEVVETNNPMLDNLVPNVIGMGADDALYLMEKAGMYVQLYGRGRVVSQSIKAGQAVGRGSTVVLTLK